MPQPASSVDPFAAVAEPRRRAILDVLADGERSVTEIVDAVDQTQPQVSQHLAVLREVDVVRFRTDGRRRLYRIHGPGLRPVHDWVGELTARWNARLDRFDEHLAELQGRDT